MLDIREVQAYTTIDGKKFLDESKAIRHAADLKRADAFDNFLIELDVPADFREIMTGGEEIGEMLAQFHKTLHQIHDAELDATMKAIGGK